jgi:DNA processing protein
MQLLSLMKHNEGAPEVAAISPRREMGAYEALWLEKGASFKTIAEKFAADPKALPSDFVSSKQADERAAEVLHVLKGQGVHRFGVRVNHAGDYPARLRDARHPVELLYYQGAWELTETRSVAVVGTRNPSSDGRERAERLARELVKRKFTVVSGLATGIDTAAHTAAIEAKGTTIAVIGTPLGSYYPRDNRELQDQIARDYLLVSQVPVLRYKKAPVPQNRFFFLERNVTMSALTEATIIVEAGETSGTLTQARAALYQRRKLFILNSCFEREDLTWPARFEAQGAIRVREPDDIWYALGERPPATDN